MKSIEDLFVPCEGDLVKRGKKEGIISWVKHRNEKLLIDVNVFGFSQFRNEHCTNWAILAEFKKEKQNYVKGELK